MSESDEPRDPRRDWGRLLRSESSPRTEAERIIRERLDRAGAPIVTRYIDVPLKEDGRPDMSGVTQEQLQESLPGLAVDLFKAHLGILEWAAGEREAPPPIEGHDEDPSELPNPAELLSPEDREAIQHLAEDIRLVMALFSDRPQTSPTDVYALGQRLQDAILSGLEQAFQSPVFDQGRLDTATLDRTTLLRVLGDRLLGLVMRFGERVESERERPASVGSARPGRVLDSPPSDGEPTSPGLVPDEGSEPVDAAPDSENVIFLDEVRDRLEQKRQQMASRLGEGVGETLGRIFGQAGDSQSMNLYLDQEFFKEHGSTLFKELLNTLSKSFVPSKVELTLPMDTDEKSAAKAPPAAPVKASDPAAGQGETDEPGEESEVKVSVNLDLADLLARLFKRKPSSPSTPSADSTETPED